MLYWDFTSFRVYSHVCVYIHMHVFRLNVKGLFKKQMDIQVEEEEEEEEEEGEGKTLGPLVPGHVTIMRRDHNQGRVSPHQVS